MMREIFISAGSMFKTCANLSMNSCLRVMSCRGVIPNAAIKYLL